MALGECRTSPRTFGFRYHQVLDSEFNLFPSTRRRLPSGVKLSLMVFLQFFKWVKNTRFPPLIPPFFPVGQSSLKPLYKGFQPLTFSLALVRVPVFKTCTLSPNAINYPNRKVSVLV